MNVIDFIRLLRKHIIILLLTPLILAAMVVILTMKPNYKFASETKLYTGIATGSSVEMDKSFNFFATTTAFDNLINIVKSRETQQEVAIRLLSQHLMLEKADPKYISARSYEELIRITPPYIYSLVERNTGSGYPPGGASRDRSLNSSMDDMMQESNSSSDKNYNDLENTDLFPAEIDREAYERTVVNLTRLMESSDTNFVYELLNFPNPHYSYKEISAVKVQRIANSDLVQLSYETDDPGICQQTLSLLTEVCIRNYKNINENRSDAVVKYFEAQLSQAGLRLKVAEDKLLEFNKDNNIINYYEQSKAVAVVKEDLDVQYNEKKIELAGIQAAIKRLEEKLEVQQQIQLKSGKIIDTKNRLGELNYKIALAETKGFADSSGYQDLVALKSEADQLKAQIKDAVSELYRYGNSTDGLPINTILNDWITNVIEAENVKAGIEVLGERIKEFQKQYAIYAPAGANIKRIEREISVSEQEYLEILHGLNLAKLKMQDIELTSNIKAVDRPYYPLSPIPTKRKLLVIIAAFFGFIIVLGIILTMEYFDNTMKNPARASKFLKLKFLGVIPKILLKAETNNFPFVVDRLLEIALQNIELLLNRSRSEKPTKTILFISILNQEGKTAIAGNLARKLKQQGKKVLVLNYTLDSSPINANALSGAQPKRHPELMQGPAGKQGRFSMLNWLLGYPDRRIDFESPFLDNPENYLDPGEYLEYLYDEKIHSVKNYNEILERNGFSISFVPDFVFIELPPVLYFSYPVELLATIDIPVLVCRSNRIWSEADQAALDVFMSFNGQKTNFILNGVELQAIESVIGEVPKKRSWLRRKIKAIFRFQFYSRSHL